MWKFIVQRLAEPSTYAGFAGLAALYGVATEHFDVYVQALVGLFSFIAVVLRENK